MNLGTPPRVRRAASARTAVPSEGQGGGGYTVGRTPRRNGYGGRARHAWGPESRAALRPRALGGGPGADGGT